MARTPLGRMLLEEGRIDELQLRSALSHRDRWGGRIGEALVAMGFISEQVMLKALARQLGVPFVELGRREMPSAVVHLVPERLIRRRRVLPVAWLGAPPRGALVVAFADPSDLRVIDDVAFATGCEVKAVLASPRDLDQAIARHLDGALPDLPASVDLPADPGPMRLTGSYWGN